MCTNYELSLYRVLFEFNESSSNTVLNVIDATHGYNLYLYNKRLPDLVSNLSYHGYLKEGSREDSYLLTRKGAIKKESLKNIIEQDNVPLPC